MADIAVSRKQRLRTLENEIRSGMEEFYYTGMKLKEIRDDELYKEDGFSTWEEYCRKRWDWDRSHVHNIITSAEYRDKLPSLASGQQWTERTVREFRRIPERDAARVAKRVIAEVEKQGHAKPTSTIVRKFVDEELGVERTKPKPEREDNGVELSHYLMNTTGTLQGTLKAVQVITDDVWKLLSKDEPGTIKRLITACESLAEFLRSKTR